MRLRLAQTYVEQNPETNVQKVLEELGKAQPDEWVVFPEAMLSGYAPEDDQYLKSVEPRWIEQAIDEVGAFVKQRSCRCLVGSAIFLDGCWRNTVLVFDGEKPEPFAMHHKVELSRLDRHHFTAGNNARVYEIAGIRFGVQACRELLFPQTWSALKSEGADIIFHINNAVQKHDSLWEHVLISRAIENSMFVCSVNNASPPQELKSYLLSPNPSYS